MDIPSLARQLMDKHNLNNWEFNLDRAKRRAGCCHHTTKTITLSSFYINQNTIEEITDTILHEIAHALAGPKQGHNHAWKAICIRIGAIPKRCYNSEKVNMPKGSWQATCNCKIHHMHRKPKHSQYFCRSCKATLTFVKHCTI